MLLELDEVYAGYEGGDVLKGVNLGVEEGSITCIVGPNGAGKSTIINLLLRFYDVTSGRILVDGRDIREMELPALRRL